MGHSHPHLTEGMKAQKGRLLGALVLTLLFVIGEIIAGIISHSLALLTDAVHNITDVIALGMSLYAVQLAGRPAHAGKTYGYHRVGIIVALVNSATLVFISLWIFYEAYQRFLVPAEIDEDILVWVGLCAFVVNSATAWMVMKGSEHDLNMRSAFLHLVADAVSTLGAVLAGVIIKFTGWHVLDAGVSVLIGGLILWNAWGVVREALDILLEGTPHDVDLERMIQDIRGVEGVQGVHDLHVWSITMNMRMLSMHVWVSEVSMLDAAHIRQHINQVLETKYSISHTTLQLECVNCDPEHLYCDLASCRTNEVHAHHHAHG